MIKTTEWIANRPEAIYINHYKIAESWIEQIKSDAYHQAIHDAAKKCDDVMVGVKYAPQDKIHNHACSIAKQAILALTKPKEK